MKIKKRIIFKKKLVLLANIKKGEMIILPIKDKEKFQHMRPDMNEIPPNALQLHDQMVEYVEHLPKTHLWDYLPIHKGLAKKVIPNRVYTWAFKQKYPDD